MFSSRTACVGKKLSWVRDANGHATKANSPTCENSCPQKGQCKTFFNYFDDITIFYFILFFSLFNDERIRFPHKFSINEVLTSCLENTRRFPLGYKLNIATGRQKKKNTTQEESAFPNLK